MKLSHIDDTRYWGPLRQFPKNHNFGSPGDPAVETNGSPANNAPGQLGGQTSYAFPFKVTNALGHTTYFKYDYYLSIAVNIKDANGLVTKVDCRDLNNVPDKLDRPTQIVRGVNLTATARERRRTLYTYDDSAHLTTIQRDLNTFGDGALKSESLYDGLGRTTETRQYETPTSSITSKITHDALGRVEFSYNPHRTTTDETYGWKRTTYDSLSRVIRIERFDKTGASTGAVQNDYSGNRVLVTDQAGKRRLSQINALGRLIEVWEITPEDTATESDSFPVLGIFHGYRTTYAYNALNSLTSVTQRVGASGTTQTRSFEYDSLQRLTRATNPESGSTWYTYDNNGNLIYKIDQMSRDISYTYDALNRITSKSGSVPIVEYVYDNQTLTSQPAGFSRGSAVGRLVAVLSQSSGGYTNPAPFGSFYGYDIAGRIKQSYQRIEGVDYGFTNITYNRADEQTVVTYPSGRSVTTAYDGAGRIASMNTTKGQITNDLIKSTSYSPVGALTSEVYGNDLIHAVTYNSRFQPTSISLGFDEIPDANFKLTYFYGQLNDPADADTMIDASKNNGNIARTRLAWGEIEQYSQSYRYDQLNRIQDYVLKLSSTGEEYGKETYEYDRFGNRGMNNALSTNWGPPLSYFNPANNRISVVPYQYNQVGNLTREPVMGGPQYVNYTYNAENKMLSGPGVSFEYDGDGRRVKKISAYGGASRKMVYNASGQLVAEYTLTGSLIKEYFYRGGQLLATINVDGTVKFGTPDHLGSVREWTYGDGMWVPDGTHDYTPFGLDLYYTLQGDGQRQQFTGYERDNETGLDYAGARCYSSNHGRFTSPDYYGGSRFNPQTLNLYSYVNNNPLKFIDPTGNFATFPHDDDKKKKPPEIIDLGSKPVETINTTEPGLQPTPKQGRLRRALGAVSSFFGKILSRASTKRPGVNIVTEAIIEELKNPSTVAGGRDADAPLLPDNIAQTFVQGTIVPKYLEHDTTFKRYFGNPEAGESPMEGRFLADRDYASSEEAIMKLALDQTWDTPNPATIVELLRRLESIA